MATVFYFYVMKKIKFFLLSIFSVFLIIACSSESDENQNQVADFDRSSILKNYAENIIIPRYNDFKLALDNLKSSVDSYVAYPMVSTYDDMHNDWFEAYKKWQHIEMFNIGKAEEIIKSTTFVISETPKGDVGKDRETKVKDRSARSYGGSDTFGKKYHSGARKVIHDMKRGVKKMKGSTNRPDSKYSGYIDDRKGKSHWHNEGQGLAGTKKHGKSDYDEPSRKKVKKD